MSAYEVAVAIVAEHRPDLLVDGEVDVASAKQLRETASSGGQAVLDVVLSLCGEGMVALHRLDALDLPNRAIIAEAMREL